MTAEILAVAFRVSKSQFVSIVEDSLVDLPEEFARFLEEVPIEIRDRPTPRKLRRAGIGPGSTLLGLYQGRPRTVRSVEDSGAIPDTIFIFQEPIESVCRN